MLDPVTEFIRNAIMEQIMSAPAWATVALIGQAGEELLNLDGGILGRILGGKRVFALL